jgi:hypothetical protein
MYMRYFTAIAVLLVLSGCTSGKSTNPVVQPPIPPATTLTISVNPTSVEPGESATLTWNAGNATACTASGAWSGSQPLIGSENVILSGSKNLSYTLSCTGANGSPSQTAVLAVAEGPGGCTIKTSVLPKTGKPMTQRRKLKHLANGL